MSTTWKQMHSFMSRFHFHIYIWIFWRESVTVFECSLLSPDREELPSCCSDEHELCHLGSFDDEHLASLQLPGAPEPSTRGLPRLSGWVSSVRASGAPWIKRIVQHRSFELVSVIPHFQFPMIRKWWFQLKSASVFFRHPAVVGLNVCEDPPARSPHSTGRRSKESVTVSQTRYHLHKHDHHDTREIIQWTCNVG